MWESVHIDAGELKLCRAYLPAARADALLSTLLTEVPWRADSVRLFGRSHPIPRRHQWYGDSAASYRWSGLTMTPLPWMPELAALRQALEQDLGCHFNSVLANLYRDGNDSMGWHADNEPELGDAPRIASLSLGAQRDLQLRPAGTTRVAHTLPLPHGSLLLMGGDMQHNWQHALPRRLRVRQPRINLTFRLIHRRGAAAPGVAVSP